MADAGADQRVRVQNLNSLKVIEGTADKGGIVRVAP
jgi:flagella basal body P-ring formation protein FlgA